MDMLLLVIAPSLIIPWLTKFIWPREINWKEMGVTMAAGVTLTAIVFAAGWMGQTMDTEILNGQVTGKESNRVSCSHSYPCNCHMVTSGFGKSQTSSMHCDTCYLHPYDIDWDVYTNIGTITINRLDSQGLDEPPRWTAVKIGEPVAQTHMFTNYVKAVPDSLFHANQVAKFTNMVPPYPDNVYDYYKLNRALAVGVNVPDLQQWNQDISMELRKLGPQKQANLIVLFVNTPDESYLHALEGQWVGGKKNDVIVIIGTTHYPQIDWVAISSWTDRQLLKVKLRDDIRQITTVDRPKIMQVIDQDVMTYFARKHMKEFAYLKWQIEPPTWVLTLAVVLGTILSAGLSFYFYKNDPFNKRSYY